MSTSVRYLLTTATLMLLVRICLEVSCAHATLDTPEVEHVAVRSQLNVVVAHGSRIAFVLCRLQ